MPFAFSNIKTTNKEIFFFFFFYITLITSFFLGENSTGGVISDYLNQKRASQAFALDFLKTFYEYDTFDTRHSPILIIFLSFFEKIKLPDILIRIIHLHLCLLLPLIFSLMPSKSLLFKYTPTLDCINPPLFSVLTSPSSL